MISLDALRMAESGRMFVAAVDTWNLFPLRLHVTVEAPAAKRLAISQIPSSRRWTLVLDPPAVTHGLVVEPQNMLIGHPRQSQAVIYANASPLPLRGKWIGPDVPLILVPAGRRVGLEMPFWGRGWLAIHYVEDDQ